MLATYWFFHFMLRDSKPVKSPVIRHYFNTQASEHH